MKRNDITPINELGSRAPEAGRIRLGVKVPPQNGKKGSMKSIDTLRFTSPDRRVIEAIAAKYGGEARPWNDPTANPQRQFEVLTPTPSVRVLLVPDGLSTWYEMWSAGGCQRRCDGLICETPQKVGYDYELVEHDCLCRQEGQRKCEPHTRLNVILPEIPFTGTWRLETKGWNAAEELPGMFDLIVACSERGSMVDADLSVERKERMTVAGKRNYVVPKLTVRATVLELAAGGGRLAVGAGAPDLPALTAGQDLRGDEPPRMFDSDDIVDAEIIDDELEEIEQLLRDDANNFGLPPDAYIAAIKATKPDDRAAWRNASVRVRAGAIEPRQIVAGRIDWKVNQP